MEGRNSAPGDAEAGEVPLCSGWRIRLFTEKKGKFRILLFRVTKL